MNEDVQQPHEPGQALEPVADDVVTDGGAFDYSKLTKTEDRQAARRAANRIKHRLPHMIQDIIETGRDLHDAQAATAPYGEWGNWLAGEWPMSARTATNWIRVAQWVDGQPEDKQGAATIAAGRLSPGMLYTLVAPSTPDSVREKVIDGTIEAADGAVEQAIQAARMIMDARPTPRLTPGPLPDEPDPRLADPAFIEHLKQQYELLHRQTPPGPAHISIPPAVQAEAELAALRALHPTAVAPSAPTAALTMPDVTPEVEQEEEITADNIDVDEDEPQVPVPVDQPVPAATPSGQTPDFSWLEEDDADQLRAALEADAKRMSHMGLRQLDREIARLIKTRASTALSKERDLVSLRLQQTRERRDQRLVALGYEEDRTEARAIAQDQQEQRKLADQAKDLLGDSPRMMWSTWVWQQVVDGLQPGMSRVSSPLTLIQQLDARRRDALQRFKMHHLPAWLSQALDDAEVHALDVVLLTESAAQSGETYDDDEWTVEDFIAAARATCQCHMEMLDEMEAAWHTAQADQSITDPTDQPPDAATSVDG